LRIAYRAKQFLDAVIASKQLVDPSLAEALLSRAEFELFLRQDKAAQQHSLRVLRKVHALGCRDALVERAALLHDVGKIGGRIKLWHRVAKVLLDRFWAEWPEHLPSEGRQAWSRPFYVQARHAARGAELVLGVGSGADLAGLIADHHTPVQQTKRQGVDAERLALLQRADTTA